MNWLQDFILAQWFVPRDVWQNPLIKRIYIDESLRLYCTESEGMIDVTSSRIIAPLWTREKAPFHFIDAEEEVF